MTPSAPNFPTDGEAQVQRLSPGCKLKNFDNGAGLLLSILLGHSAFQVGAALPAPFRSLPGAKSRLSACERRLSAPAFVMIMFFICSHIDYIRDLILSIRVIRTLSFSSSCGSTSPLMRVVLRRDVDNNLFNISLRSWISLCR